MSYGSLSMQEAARKYCSLEVPTGKQKFCLPFPEVP